MTTHLSTTHPWDNWTPHQILGLKPGASCKSVRNAWTKQIWEHHPDLQPHDLKMHGRELTAKANAAYHDLYAPCRDESYYGKTGSTEQADAGYESHHTHATKASPYSVLGIEPGANCEDIHNVWQAKVWEHHPDLQPNHLKAEGREVTAELNAAYEELSAHCPSSHGVDISGDTQQSHNETSLS